MDHAQKKITVIHQEEVLPLTNVNVEAGRRKPAPGKDIRMSHVEVVRAVEAGNREIPSRLPAILVVRSHLKLSAHDRQHQRTKFRALKHLLGAIDPEQPYHIGENFFRLLMDWQERVVEPAAQQSVLQQTLERSF